MNFYVLNISLKAHVHTHTHTHLHLHKIICILLGISSVVGVVVIVSSCYF